MGQSRHRSRSSNWSSAPCLVALNFLCYGNACSMLLDRYRAFTRSLSSSVCAFYFSSRVTSRQFKHVRFILSFGLSVASSLTYFGEGPKLLTFNIQFLSILCASIIRCLEHLFTVSKIGNVLSWSRGPYDLYCSAYNHW